MTGAIRQTRPGRIAGLDVLRGIAIGLVMLRHAFPDQFAGAGVVGVVMFFALSGYLITGLLVDELDETGRVNFRHFYLRRARRLVPAMLFLIAGVVAVTLTLNPIGDRWQLGKTVAVALTWTGNLPFGHASDATFHLWTLATEEQFYLLWPAILAFAFARLKVRTALVAVGVACVVGCVATLGWLWEAPDLAYSLPTSWAVCFVIGAATRVYRDRIHPPAWAVPAALAALAVQSVIPLRGTAFTYLAGGPAIALLTGVLLLSWRTWTDVTTPALRALTWLGTVSYGAYLWNYPLSIWLRPHLDAWAGIVALVGTLAMATVSWHLVERPLQRVRVA